MDYIKKIIDAELSSEVYKKNLQYIVQSLMDDEIFNKENISFILEYIFDNSDELKKAKILSIIEEKNRLILLFIKTFINCDIESDEYQIILNNEIDYKIFIILLYTKIILLKLSNNDIFGNNFNFFNLFPRIKTFYKIEDYNKEFYDFFLQYKTNFVIFSSNIDRGNIEDEKIIQNIIKIINNNKYKTLNILFYRNLCDLQSNKQLCLELKKKIPSNNIIFINGEYYN